MPPNDDSMMGESAFIKSILSENFINSDDNGGLTCVRTLRTWDFKPSRPASTTAAEMDLLLDKLPQVLSDFLRHQFADKVRQMNEIYLQLGLRPKIILCDPITGVKQGIFLGDVKCTVEHLDLFAQFFLQDSASGNLESKRKGIPKTLHRLSVVTKPAQSPSQTDQVIGVAVRVGRSFDGLLMEMTGKSLIYDLARARKSLLLIGKPGVGKTTVLREIARRLSEESDLEVVVIDKTCEIAGDGLEPHPCIGNARWMPVGVVGKQHEIMREAVENQSPDVIIVDEISTHQEVHAARTICQRGVMLIATVHGTTLPELILCKERGSLIGSITSVTLSGQEADRRRDKRKQVQKRAQEPAFHAALELHSRGQWVFHHSIKEATDAYFEGEPCDAEEFRPGKSIAVAAIPGEGTFEYCYKCGLGPTCNEHLSHGIITNDEEVQQNQYRNQSSTNPRPKPTSFQRPKGGGNFKKPKRNHYGRHMGSRGSGICGNCGRPGHYTRDCPNR